MRKPLFKYQEPEVQFLMDNPVAMLNADRGTGKTPVACVAIERMFDQGMKRALYVGPLSTLENVRREARKFCERLRPVIVVGSPAARRRILLDDSDGYNMFIINYEGLRVLSRELSTCRFDIVVADESTRIKDRGTQVAKILKIIGSIATRRWCLTSLPFTEGVEESWSQFDFLDNRILGENYYAFRNRYCVVRELRFGGKRIQKIESYKNLEEFEQRIRPFIMRVSKAECLDLPAKTYQILEVEMDDAQKAVYSRVEDMTFQEIGEGTVTHVMALTKMAKCRQVAAGFLYDDERETQDIPSRKYNELKSIVAELSARRKAVVFTAFRAEPPRLMKKLAADFPKLFLAQLPDNPMNRQPIIDEWTAWNGPAVLVTNVKSGGVGLNLQAADTAVFFTNDYSLESRVQAEDRIHRIGQSSNKVTIIDIVTKGTVEEDVLKALTEKKDLVECFLERLSTMGRPQTTEDVEIGTTGDDDGEEQEVS
jgi:SNF2 family DNA or RNA helicase